MVPASPSNGFVIMMMISPPKFAEDIAMDMEHLKITIADMTRDG